MITGAFMDISWILVACLGIYILYLDKVWEKRLEEIKPRNPRYDHYICTVTASSHYFISSNLAGRSNVPYTKQEWGTRDKFNGRTRGDHLLFVLTHDLLNNTWVASHPDIDERALERLSRCCKC